MKVQDVTVKCQYCESDNTYVAGFSALCVETQYKCQDCHGETWHDDRQLIG